MTDKDRVALYIDASNSRSAEGTIIFAPTNGPSTCLIWSPYSVSTGDPDATTSETD